MALKFQLQLREPMASRAVVLVFPGFFFNPSEKKESNNQHKMVIRCGFGPFMFLFFCLFLKKVGVVLVYIACVCVLPLFFQKRFGCVLLVFVLFILGLDFLVAPLWTC